MALAISLKGRLQVFVLHQTKLCIAVVLAPSGVVRSRLSTTSASCPHNKGTQLTETWQGHLILPINQGSQQSDPRTSLSNLHTYVRRTRLTYPSLALHLHHHLHRNVGPDLY